MNPDEVLVDYVNRAINAGYTTIKLPQAIIIAASAEALEAICQLCRLCNIEISAVTRNAHGGWVSLKT